MRTQTRSRTDSPQIADVFSYLLQVTPLKARDGRQAMEMGGRIGDVCRQARKTSGVRLIDVATTAGVSESTISRFEHGNWPRDADRIVEAYARECGLEPMELWRRATE